MVDLKHMPPKKEVDLFEETFAIKDMSIMEEIASYLTANSIILDGDSLILLKGNESQNPLIATTS